MVTKTQVPMRFYLAAGTYGIKYTTGSRYDFDFPDQTIGSGGIVTTNIPDVGVITIYAKVKWGGSRGSKRAGWPRAVARPGLPRIRTCAINASGSSSHGFAAQVLSVEVLLTRKGFLSIRRVSLHRVHNSAPPFLRRVPWA